MSVTNYNPSLDSGCKYSYDKLKNVVYLLSAEHVKDVYIDNGEAYISGLTEDPLRLNGFNIQMQEETSLDERYRFVKQVTLSLNGYVNVNFFGLRYYVIVESIDGTYWLVNVDFPSKVTYNFQLGDNINQTDFTFTSFSNFPTLKLNTTFDPFSPTCLGYNVNGIDSLRLLEKNYTALDEANKVVYTYGQDFKNVKYLGNSCSLSETYDGERIQTQIQFNIAFDDYKSSWQYNLLEFVENIYCAVVLPKGRDNVFFCGYNFGLQPQYAIQSNSSDEGSDIITITLTEVSNHGLTAESDYREEQASSTKWNYVEKVDKVPTYVCVGTGVGQYLVQQETDLNGNITGDYKALEGYEHEFPSLNIVGTFNDIQTFSKPSCEGEWDECHLVTNMPNTITYSAETCHTYTISGSCDWSIEELPSYLTALPSSGSAGTQYSLSLCNTLTPDSPILTTFNIRYGNSIRVQPVTITNGDSYITPTSITISYLAQNVTFNFNPNCPITVVGADPSLTINIGYGTMTVTVPRNDTVANRTFTITVRDCKGIETQVVIIQGYVNYEWRDTSGYICESGNSYVRQQKWILKDGTWQPTDEYRAGSLIQSGDTRCSSAITKYEFNGGYYCVDGNKVECLEEFVSYDGGTTWTKTGAAKLGNVVETSSSFCNEPVTYSWRLTDKWQCGWEYPVIIDGGYLSTPQQFNIKINGLDVPIQIQGNEWLVPYSGTVNSLDGAVSGNTAITSLTMHDDIKLGNNISLTRMFMGCNKLESVDITPLVTHEVIIADMRSMFGYCESLKSLDLSNFNTSNVTDMAYMLSSCRSLTTLNLSNFDTSNCANMESMFNGCRHITSLDVSSFDTSNVTDMVSMFSSCESLKSLDLSNFNTSNVTNMQSMFHVCSGLTSLDVSSFDTSKVTDMGNMFGYCESLTSLDLSNFNTSKVAGMGYMFFKCSGLTSLDLSSFDTSSATNMVSMFGDCSGLTSLNLSNFDTSNVTNMAYMFQSCKSLTALNLSNFNTSNVSNMSRMFYFCSGLTSLDLSSFDTSNVTNMAYMFQSCKSLTALNLSNFNTSNVTNMAWMFYGCTSLTTLDLSSFNFDNVQDYTNMFNMCTSLQTIYCSATNKAFIEARIADTWLQQTITYIIK